MKILSIDAWGNETDGYEWNNWHTVGTIDEIPKTDDEIIQYFIDEGYLKPNAKGLVTLDDDQFNILILDKRTLEPLFAIEYGGAE